MNIKKVNLLLFLFLSIYSSVNLVGQIVDYQQIIFYGQSLSLGWESPRAITTDALDDTYMLGSHVNTYYTSNGTVLNPLKSGKTGPVGEQPIVSCVNVFSEAYRENINSDQKFIAFAGGWGGQTIEKLSKESTNDENYYDTTFLQYLDNTLTAIDDKTVNCPAIVYMQGEHNSVAWRAEDEGLTSGSNGTTDKTTYKDLLLTLKNNMQADIMSKYNQTEKPLFFIYQTSGGYIQLKDMPVVMGQIEFAEENSDVILLNPHYAMPDYNGGHLSTNGYRWYGELVAKSLVNKLIDKETPETLEPTNFEIDGEKITIDYKVPALPLVLDTWTTPMQSNYGFVVYKNESIIEINSVSIVNDNQIVLNCNEQLTGKIEIIYAGNTTSGSGNLRDSDNRSTSTYTYFDDSSDSSQESYTPTTQSGGSIYGESYGLQNWSNMFYYDISVDDVAAIGETFTEGNYTYTITGVNPNEAELSGSSLTQLNVPSSATNESSGKTYSITAIGENTFHEIPVSSVVLPSTVTTIKHRAFRKSGLTSINLENVITLADKDVFSECKLSKVDLSKVTYIGRFAFNSNKSLPSIEIPVAETISDGAFRRCVFSEITIPSSVTTIGDNIFNECTDLKTIHLGWGADNVVNVSSKDIFIGISDPSLITVYVPKGSSESYIGSGWDAGTIVELDQLSIDGVSNDLGVAFSPNPTSDYLNIQTNNNIQLQLDVYNISGKNIISKNLKNDEVLDLRNLISGVYFVKVSSNKKVYFKKIIKN